MTLFVLNRATLSGGSASELVDTEAGSYLQGLGNKINQEVVVSRSRIAAVELLREWMDYVNVLECSANKIC